MFIRGDSKEVLSHLPDNFVDLIVTDPPYGISFMGKDWDKALPDQEVWNQCYRVLKEGKVAFVMCSPRQDVLARMIISLEDAGFKTGYTSIYWSYASGFPKAANVSKLIDKRNGRTQETYKPFAEYLKQKRLENNLSMSKIDELLGTNTAYSWWEGRLSGIQLPSKQLYLKLKEILNLDNRFDELIEREEAEREIIGNHHRPPTSTSMLNIGIGDFNYTKSKTEEAIKMEGAYVGFQPKPAVEIILVVSKGKTLTWLDDCRIPYSSDSDYDNSKYGAKTGLYSIRKMQIDQGDRHNLDVLKRSGEQIIKTADNPNQKGRFPANLLVSDDILNDGKSWRGATDNHLASSIYGNEMQDKRKGWGKENFGSYSRYFDLDKWYSSTFPFIITPKASKSERNEGCEDLPLVKKDHLGGLGWKEYQYKNPNLPRQNYHPTVKPIKLMSYLITLGSRESDLILDPFCGSGTTYKACLQLNRNCIGIEINKEYIAIAQARVKPLLEQEKISSLF